MLLIHTSSLPLESTVREHFLATSILAPLVGFHMPHYPLWKLGYLLDEKWVEEDILDALAELTYFTHAALQHHGKPPPVLYFPTKFLTDARLLYCQSPRMYSPELSTFHEHLQSTTVDFIGFLSCVGGHYSGFILDRTGLSHADSLGYPASTGILGVIQWLLLGTGYPVPSSIVEVDFPRQNSSGPGSGSCGIAAHNFITHSFASCSASHGSSMLRTASWTSEASPFFRDQALQDMIQFHLCALASPMVRH